MIFGKYQKFFVNLYCQFSCWCQNNCFQPFPSFDHLKQRHCKSQTLATASLCQYDCIPFLRHNWYSLHLHRCRPFVPTPLNRLQQVLTVEVPCDLREWAQRRWALITLHFDVVFGAYGVYGVFAFVYEVLDVFLELVEIFRFCLFERVQLLID